MASCCAVALRHHLLRFRSTEFTDEEIAAAFKFLDLDRNLHIGAAEIRHILICMGELITDEEVPLLRIKSIAAHGIDRAWWCHLQQEGALARCIPTRKKSRRHFWLR